MIKKFYKNRFEIFFFSMLTILFGSLVVPIDFFEKVLVPILFLINIIAGILLISKKKKLVWFFIILLISASSVFGADMMSKHFESSTQFIRMGIYFLFYSTVTIEIIKQVWNAKFVNKNVIIGLMSGYVSLGLIAFFIFTSIDISTPGSFEGILLDDQSPSARMDSLIYYSYITLLTIGYGEIIPVTPVAQKAAILVGLMGQFYIVIITAVVVEKYIRHSNK
ncbi:hypothetical protein GWK08_05525 [Leptobacterium flavescens]|uniref:Potassium channel domain-containing protein n=1 Tax=Leptobacterium flavescens TaxID=472055 RepID=A0A6P0UKF2_9FLAO|nr:ion channel [Leptobacterium flavescens]NER12890.1 hypothetical protein [Leptobacterium flavescens]